MHLTGTSVRVKFQNTKCLLMCAGYGMPIDEDELDRIDLKHRLYTLLLNEKHFLAPIGRNPQRILDLGTGSGKTRMFPK
jgi:hypothetical protein